MKNIQLHYVVSSRSLAVAIYHVWDFIIWEHNNYKWNATNLFVHTKCWWLKCKLKWANCCCLNIFQVVSLSLANYCHQLERQHMEPSKGKCQRKLLIDYYSLPAGKEPSIKNGNRWSKQLAYRREEREVLMEIDFISKVRKIIFKVMEK